MFCFLSLALAHPFDAELYGHDLQVSFVENTMEVVYHAEVPYPVVQQELRDFLEKNRHVPLDELRTQYLANRYGELKEGLSLQVDGNDTTWETTAPFPQTLQKEGQFLRFRLQLSHSFDRGAYQISIWNQNHRDQLSVYRSDIRYDAGVWIDEYDLEHPRKWSKDEARQELRMSLRFLPSFWRMLSTTWAGIIQEDAVQELRPDENHSLLFLVKRRKVPLEIAMGLLLLLLFVSFRAPVKRDIHHVGLLLILIGLGVALEELGDARIWAGIVVSVICALRYRALALFFLLQLCLPWWLLLIFLLPSFRSSVR